MSIISPREVRTTLRENFFDPFWKEIREATILHSNDSGSSEALFWGGFGLAIGGGMVNVSANESLSQSVWMYNSTLETMGR